MTEYIITGNKILCCGCRACEQICPRNAIEMQEDEEGFLFPILNKNICNQCKLCSQVCPITNANKTVNKPGVAYAVQNKDKKILNESSSGGVFSVIALNVLRKGGLVYGAAFDENMFLSHIRISDEKELQKLRGSKYLQSDTKVTFEQTKQDLRQGTVVYYTGTPCQIAALKLYLRKEYDNLITSDLVCHGTPSQKIFSTVISHIEKEKNGKIVAYSFRDKTIGGWSCSSSSSSYKNNAKNVFLPYNFNMLAYFNAFLQGYIHRMSCYKCPFATQERVGDLTLADYWGIKEYHPEFHEISDGVSLVLVNNEKAMRFWNSYSNKVIQIESKIEYAQKINSNLREPSTYRKERENTYDLAFNHYEIFRKSFLPSNIVLHTVRFYLKFILIRNFPKIYKLIKSLR